MKTKIALIGATGNVGRRVTAMLIDRVSASSKNLVLFASPQSSGKQLAIGNNNFVIHNTEEESFSGFDICIFNTESAVSSTLIPRALQGGAYVVDSSSHYRLHPDIPLIIPPINKNHIVLKKKLYAHANCLASPIATVIGPLHQFNPILRVNVITYQSTSGAGKAATDECWNEAAALILGQSYTRHYFKRQIAFNVIPQVETIGEDGYTFEEYKIIHEVKKVIEPTMAITATAVRVPVMIGHAIALNLEFRFAFDLNEIVRVLQNATSIKISEDHYSTPVEVVGTDDVFVGRIRHDSSIKNGLHLWLCSDNLRRGAATDSIEIVEEILKKLGE